MVDRDPYKAFYLCERRKINYRENCKEFKVALLAHQEEERRKKLEEIAYKKCTTSWSYLQKRNRESYSSSTK